MSFQVLGYVVLSQSRLVLKLARIYWLILSSFFFALFLSLGADQREKKNGVEGSDMSV